MKGWRSVPLRRSVSEPKKRARWTAEGEAVASQGERSWTWRFDSARASKTPERARWTSKAAR